MVSKKSIWRKKQIEEKEIARKRIRKLFELADKEFYSNSDLSNRYVSLAMKIARKYNIKINQEYRYKFCKYCETYTKLNKNAELKIDTKKKLILFKCLNCGKVRNYKYK